MIKLGWSYICSWKDEQAQQQSDIANYFAGNAPGSDEQGEVEDRRRDFLENRTEIHYRVSGSWRLEWRWFVLMLYRGGVVEVKLRALPRSFLIDLQERPLPNFRGTFFPMTRL